MKFSKPLKSTVLSVALLFVGGAQAQKLESVNNSTGVIVRGPDINLTVGAISFGSHTAPTAVSSVTLRCFRGGNATTTSATKIIDGSCGLVTVTSGSDTLIKYKIFVTATAMTFGGVSITPTLGVFVNGIEVPFNNDLPVQDDTTSSRLPRHYEVGGTLDIPANTPLGLYTGTYTFMLRIV